MSIRYPETIRELVDFYYDEFKPVYSGVQQTNDLPLEMLLEINAAFDHWTRILKYGESEAKAIRTIAAHLKRGCFDAFKITMMNTREQYDELKRTDLSVIDNGQFIHAMNALWTEIEKLGLAARISEGDSRDEERWHEAFDNWGAVTAKCAEFTEKFYHNKNVTWARTRESRRESWKRFEGIGIGVIGSLIAAVIWHFAVQS